MTTMFVAYTPVGILRSTYYVLFFVLVYEKIVPT